MSATQYIMQSVFPAALGMLPAKMDTPAARTMLLAIGLQESRFEHRVQIGGPAHGFWQFEKGGGVKGVLTHASTKLSILGVLDEMACETTVERCYEAIVDNDILACVFARLLLYTLPQSLPARNNAAGAWSQYIAAWRPGKPHRQTWDGFYEQAWELVDG